MSDDEGDILVVASMVVLWFQTSIFNTWELKVWSVGYRKSDGHFFIEDRWNIVLVCVVLDDGLYV